MSLNPKSYQKLVKSAIGKGDFPVALPPFILFNGLHVMSVEENDSYEAHTHNFCEVIISLTGVYKCLLNNELLITTPGSLIFIQYGDRHEDLFQSGASFAALSFKIGNEYLRHIFNIQAAAQSRILLFSSNSSLQVLLNEMRAESGRKHSTVGIMEGLCQAFFWKLVEGIPPELLSETFKKSVEDDSFQRCLLAIFNESLNGSFDIAHLASRLGISERKVYTLCKKLLGSPPAHAFMALKMREAARILAEGNVKVTEVSKYLGFDDPFHFSRAFKRHIGISPGLYAETPFEIPKEALREMAWLSQ